jgi:Zn-dependent protease
MFRSYRLFNAFGIPIKVHGTLILFLLVAAFLFSYQFGGVLATALFLVSVFGFVLLHELGHSLVAQYYGIQVREITLYPIGGVAGLAQMPRVPHIELHVAIAGPLVNLILAGLFAILNAVVASPLLTMIVGVNLALALFNLIPGFPLDGGRILRALLARRTSYLRATEIATRIGQTVAVGLGILGLLSFHLMLVLLSVFIFFAAKAELYSLMMEEERANLGRAFFFPTVRMPWHHGFREGGRTRSQQKRSRVIEVLPDGTVRTLGYR